MTRSRRLGPLVVAVVASAVVVAGPAYAADPPAPGTACDEQVAADKAVADAKAENPPDDAKVAAAEKAAADTVCPETPPSGTGSATDPADTEDPASPGPDAGTSATSDTPGQANRTGPSSAGNQAGRTPFGPAPKRAGRPAGDRDCPDFATQAQAQQYFELIGGSATNNADRLDANHNGVACESYFDDGDNQDAAVSTTGDDGSEAKTSGDQVTDVPEGSAQTGGF